MYQRTVIVGNVGKDAEMRYTPTSVPVTSFISPSTAAGPAPAANSQEKTTWFRVTCWRKLAETAAQWVKKGKLFFVKKGEVEAQAYIDREGAAGEPWN